MMGTILGLEQIATKEGGKNNKGKNIFDYPSDSDVYTDGQICFKHYFGLSQEQIQLYHILQSWIGKGKIKINLESISGGVLKIASNKIINTNSREKITICNIEFSTLILNSASTFLAADIQTRSDIVVTNPDYIEGKTMFDVYISSLQNDENIHLIISSVLKELNNRLSKVIDISLSDVPNGIQIHGINCKIVYYKNATLYVTITDIARNILDIISNNKDIIESIVSP